MAGWGKAGFVTRMALSDSDRDFLFELLETPSPVGHEMPGQRVWAKHIGQHADSVECDAYGSTWATLQGESDKVVMLAAHADEIGYVVKHVTKEGFIRIDRLGGSDAAVGQGRRLTIFGDKGEVPAILGNTAIHLRRDSVGNEKAPKVHELWVDVGASSEKDVAELGVRVGHPAVYKDGPMMLSNGRIVSRAIDNRVGGFIIAKVLQQIAESGKKPAHTLVCLNAVQEEIGGNGATMATHRIRPDSCLCLDVTHATDTPGLDFSKVGKVTLGGGPTVSHGGANHPMVVKKLIETAEAEKLDIQHEAAGRFTGTDTDSIFVSRDGVPSALVSLPLRCMHSVVETADVDDIEETIRLMAGFVTGLEVGDDFHQTL